MSGNLGIRSERYLNTTFSEVIVQRAIVFVFILLRLIYFYNFIFWLCWVSFAAHRLSLVAVSGAYSLLQCAGFSLQWLLLWSMGSRCLGFSSCGSWAQLLWGMWDLPRSGIEPVSLAWQGRFLTTGPPGKPRFLFVLIAIRVYLLYNVMLVSTV